MTNKFNKKKCVRLPHLCICRALLFFLVQLDKYYIPGDYNL